MKKIIFGLIFLVLISGVVAQSEMILKGLEQYSSEIQGQKLPGFAKQLFGNEQININVALNDGETLNYGLITKDGQIISLSAGTLENPTLNVYGTEEVIMELAQSADPLSEFQQALNQKKISYQAVGVQNKLKYGLGTFMLRVVGWFR